tara:strand:+ start:159 stop:614 length:456 start_codon:yes stop_codon:yes gene_type:complete
MKIAIGLLVPKKGMGKEIDMEKEMGMPSLLDEPFVDNEKYPLTEESNKKMMMALMETRHLGPKDPASPGKFWIELSDFWGLEEEETKTHRCANCEYFDNSVEALVAMQEVPEDSFDASGGGRGYCHKYTFICHNLRVCDQWEEDQEENEDD